MVSVTYGKGPSGKMEILLTFLDRNDPSKVYRTVWLQEDTAMDMAQQVMQLRRITKKKVRKNG
jgi:hypothetical protein